ncbi:hypothetical protein JDV02_006033 [Purpureocillium takamizusanense]|uniref:Uncharacterized protein n=1 Tax=Purpureocillium takamizusanense TaxID=2060973 RepID=A0A9Q8QJE7_9HYPO|nr:uncharacterized protein JDV02_006033 [Purpureocillium takamizusanense]UNI19889.1 hypothetical protein JDV02_006033 [Purpureocillium takamizusanense]
MDPAAGDGDDANDAAAAAMAQMMGFSAFGAQDRPQKKRRYNPLADAATEQQHLSKQQHHLHHHHHHRRQGNSHGAASSTGSNATPLGATKRDAGGATASVRPSAATNTDEISLEDENDEVEPAIAAAAAAADDDDDDVAESAAAAESSTTTIASLPRPAGLPERPAPGVGFVGMPPRRRGHGEPQDHHHIRDRGPSSGKPWYEDYYDPSSNENPWERLESSMGLLPRGSWLARGHRQHATTPPAQT